MNVIIIVIQEEIYYRLDYRATGILLIERLERIDCGSVRCTFGGNPR